VNLGVEKQGKKKKGGQKGARLPEDLHDDDVFVLSDSRVKVRTLEVPCHDFRLLLQQKKTRLAKDQWYVDIWTREWYGAFPY
jgi:hypothetical protein